MNFQRAVITGMGAVCAAGADLEEIFHNFSKGKRETKQPSLFTPLEKATDFNRWLLPIEGDGGLKPSPPQTVREQSSLTGFTSGLGYPVFQVKKIPDAFHQKNRRTLSLVLWALGQAMGGDEFKNLRVGICLGTTVASQLNDIGFYKSYRNTKKPGLKPVARYLDSNLSENISKKFDFNGPVNTVVNACSSGADSIGVGLEWLRSDICDAVICGGADELSAVPYYGFGSLGVVSKQACRPFDQNRTGLNLGEGAGVLILEKQSIAKRRGKPTSLFVAGYGSEADSYHLTTPHPEGLGLKASLNRAFSDSGIEKKEVSFINAHGTATPENDKVEGKTLKQVFGEQVKFFSTKGFTGHTLGAAGGLEAVFTAYSLTKGWIPPNIGFNTEDKEIGISPVKDKQDISGNYAISTSSAFGGTNIALVIGKQ